MPYEERDLKEFSTHGIYRKQEKLKTASNILNEFANVWQNNDKEGQALLAQQKNVLESRERPRPQGRGQS